MQQVFYRYVSKLVKIERHEIAAATMSFALVFTLLASYYVLRPVRDAMSSDWSDAELSWLWTLNFFISAGAVLAYGYVVSRVRVRSLVPLIYSFFALSFLLFFSATHYFSDTTLIDKSFYVWVSFFAMFNVSVFWSFMSDIYTRSQSRRLFGIFSAGASIGAVAGPMVPVLLGDVLGVYNLLFVAALMLLFTLPIIYFLDRARFNTTPEDESDSSPALNQSLRRQLLFRICRFPRPSFFVVHWSFYLAIYGDEYLCVL